jgi:peptidoglycan/xylan/chitin deacetylase (PgdA/CDA1 family)
VPRPFRREDAVKPLQVTEPMAARRRVLRTLQGSLYWSGAAFAYSRATRGGCTILMYHSIAPPDLAPSIDPRVRLTPEVFSKQMRFLSRHRKVIRLSDLAKSVALGRPPERGSVVISFDDGYRDNLEVAAPILRQLGLPSTLNLPTSYIDSGENQWVDRLYTMLVQRREDSLELDLGGPRHFDLRDPAQQLDLHSGLVEQLILASMPEREAILCALEGQLRPAASPPSLMLDWDGVRSLIREFPDFGIGSHTMTHADMSHLSIREAEAEITGSVEAIEAQIDRKVESFCFPYSRSNEALHRLVEKSGLATGLTSGPDCLLTEDSDSHGLARIEPDASQTLLKLYTSGAYPDLSQKLLGGRQ